MASYDADASPEAIAAFSDETPLIDFMLYVELHGTSEGYQPLAESIDTSLSDSRAGCMLGWYCRYEGQGTRGCERGCMFTRHPDEERPRCFGFHGGKGVLQMDDFLYQVLNLSCLDCFHFADCCDETDARWGA